MGTAETPPESAKAPETRARLLAESVRLIEDVGLGGLSFREVARRAGVSHQLPYHYFKSREGILAEIALDGFQRLDDALQEAELSSGFAPPRTRLRAVVSAYIRFALSAPVHYRIMFRHELVDLERQPPALSTAHRTFDRLLAAVSACHPRKDPTTVAVAIWAGAHGAVTLSLDGVLDRGRFAAALGPDPAVLADVLADVAAERV